MSDPIAQRAAEIQRKLDRHLHLSVMEQTVRALVRTIGLDQTRAILQHYVDKTEEY